jgi:hypothetical protein
MFLAQTKQILLTGLLLIAALTGTCAGSLIESLDSESSPAEVQELILTQRHQEKRKNGLVSHIYHCFSTTSSALRDSTPLPNRRGIATDLQRNGIGGPLVL